uniref:Uncharacterized protein n=1 Tax=Oryza glumipatula TaxID=40148 RepID=A0A0E0B583_9ORYZ
MTHGLVARAARSPPQGLSPPRGRDLTPPPPAAAASSSMSSPWRPAEPYLRRRGSRVQKRVCLSDILGMSQMRGSGVLHVCTTEGMQLGIQVRTTGSSFCTFYFCIGFRISTPYCAIPFFGTLFFWSTCNGLFGINESTEKFTENNIKLRYSYPFTSLHPNGP